MPATIILERHTSSYGPWWSVELVAGSDTLTLDGKVGTEGAAEDVASRWADHLDVEIERRDWS